MTVRATPLSGETLAFMNFPVLAGGAWARGMEEWRRVCGQNVDATQMLLEANMRMLTFLKAESIAPTRPERFGVAFPPARRVEDIHQIKPSKEAIMADEHKIDDTHFHKVSERAYAKWMDEGQAHGRDQEHWRDAEAEIIAEEEQEAAKASALPRPTTESPKSGNTGSSKRAA